MLTRIRNAQMRRRPKVVTSPASNLRAHVLDVLAEEGYIRGYARVDHKNGLSPSSRSSSSILNGQPAIRQIKPVISKPGRRVYSAAEVICRPMANGLGVAILSTPKGVMSDTRAREKRRSAARSCASVF